MNSLELAFVYIVIWISVLILTKIKYRKILKINFLYTSLWCFCGISSMYNNLGLLKPGIYIHKIIIISIVIFNTIYVLRH